ncbi:MAG: tryptophan synthase subunit alpha [Candidatus Sumerlaeia bacterium]
MNRIDANFRKCKEQGRAAMIFYITAGYPDIPTTETVIDALAEAGADVVEIGIPFSDPIADGPTIQEASTVALNNGVTVQAILNMTMRVRKRHPELGLLLFGAYNPILHYGEIAFAESAATAGADGLLVPDLPPEAAGKLQTSAEAQDMGMVYLVAPTTTPERARKITEASRGFIYYISIKGVTGARAELPPDLEPRVKAVKELTDKPVAVGFGVAEPAQARAIASFADGVIVGSALIKIVGANAGTPELADRVRDYARSLVEAVK